MSTPPTDPASDPVSAEPADSRVMTGRQRLAAALWPPRLTASHVLVAALLALLGAAVTFQARFHGSDTQLSGARQSDLVRILDDVADRSDRLSEESQRLEINLERLRGGANREAAALEQSEARAQALGILTGSVAAQGPGIELTINDPARQVDATNLLDALQELRDAGAEAVQINSVRVVADTFFVDAGPGRVRVGDVELPAPYIFLVVGDPRTLQSALSIPGGVIEVLRGKDAQATISQRQRVTITAVDSPDPPRYTRPTD